MGLVNPSMKRYFKNKNIRVLSVNDTSPNLPKDLVLTTTTRRLKLEDYCAIFATPDFLVVTPIPISSEVQQNIWRNLGVVG
jgi:hypothetical protein